MSRMKGHLYFIGITGHAMRGLALAVRELGYEVSGLDPSGAPPGSDWLDEHHIPWKREYADGDLEGVTAVVITGAHVSPDAAPIIAARAHNLPVKSYAQLVGELTLQERVVAVAGTHGKTTTTSLITWLLEHAGRRPDFLVGIRPFNFDSSVRLAGSDIAVIEADEYRASQLEDKSKVQYYHPNVLVLTSLEHDHPDFFPDLASVKRRFAEVIDELPSDGRLVAWDGSDDVMDVAARASCPIVTYGLEGGDYTARDVAYLPAGLEFDVLHDSQVLGRVAIPLYGQHNVLNALAAVVVALGEGLSIDEIIDGAATFKGAYRRFNVISRPGARITVIDDYAHHPTEAATNIEAAKLHFPDHRVIVVYRPHTYSRTAALLAEYRTAFDRADQVYITDIEGAREAGAEHTVSGQDIVSGITAPAAYVDNRDELIGRLVEQARPGDVVLCFSVSGYDGLAQSLAERLGN
jgi:UDP-N-acetylmuramate: L-alanyl-gamma-D-glutamyl-meso-diaminopimelate ligase